ncbi:MAG TPA: DNA-3-methyladenine glycosylase [Phnomibacter sp.]|nr:DNA-3-methyladenine glycosylase [Phnomibacter sp.]
MKKLDVDFFLRTDTLSIAQALLGKLIISRFDGREAIGRIVETEAYLGITDRASHAYGGRRTARTRVMYLPGGHAYVYLCYGIHHLFNIVTNRQDIPHAILLRALEPVAGLDIMMQRRQKQKADHSLTRGPGSLSQAMGFHTGLSGMSLGGHSLFIADDGFHLQPQQMGTSPRIGVDYAGEDALLPYRFFVRGNAWVSGQKNG